MLINRTSATMQLLTLGSLRLQKEINPTETNMKIEFQSPAVQMLSREEVIKLLKDNPKYFEESDAPAVEILRDGEVVHRTRRLGKVEKLFAKLLDDIKKIKE